MNMVTMMSENKGKQGEPPATGSDGLVLPARGRRTYLSQAGDEGGGDGSGDAALSGNGKPGAAPEPVLPPIPEIRQRVYLNRNSSGGGDTPAAVRQRDKLEETAEMVVGQKKLPGDEPPADGAASGDDDTGANGQNQPSDHHGMTLNVLARKIPLPPHNDIRELAARGKYRIEQMIARGAESVLYKASTNGHQVCVKAVRNTVNKWLGDAKTRNQEERLEKVTYRTKLRHIQNEFRISELLYSEADTPTVHIYALRRVTRMGLELGYDLIMEYLNGHDLGDKILSRSLTLADKVNVFYRAVQAVSYMHKKNLIHLDIKPSNFMLVRDQIKLIDFGVSVGNGYRPRAITGTSGYLSPEQICKETLDEGTDIFALGVAFAVFFGGKSLNQPQDVLLRRQTRLDAQYHLGHDEQPVVNEAPDLNNVPPIFEVLRACTIPRRDLRVNKCEVLLNLLRQKAELAGIRLID